MLNVSALRIELAHFAVHLGLDDARGLPPPRGERLRWTLRIEAPLSDGVRRVVDDRDPAFAKELLPRAKRRRGFLFW